MRQIKISDITMREISGRFRLSFKEKIELAKHLDKLGVDYIELEPIKNAHVDRLQIKSIATAVSESGIAVPVDLNSESVNLTWEAIKEAKKPRLQIYASASAVQIEYLFKKKPEAMLSAVESTVREAKALCDNVELIVGDATRGECDFTKALIEAAIEAGAVSVTLCDSAGTMLPEEFAEFVKNTAINIPALLKVELGASVKNTISLADASLIAALPYGVDRICAAAYPTDSASIEKICRILSHKKDTLGVSFKMNSTALSVIMERINRICSAEKNSLSGSVSYQGEEDIYLTSHDDFSAVCEAVLRLGYDLSSDDVRKVYLSFTKIAERKERVSLKELDAIVASSAMQVPPAYELDSYLVSTGNTVSATAHIKLIRNGVATEGVYIGNGPIGAAFYAIEKITGRHYELDDFQLQAVTEGREAMGQTVVKLRAGGNLYSGIGISTDIVGAGIQAYLNALNKIIYEEEVE